MEDNELAEDSARWAGVNQLVLRTCSEASTSNLNSSEQEFSKAKGWTCEGPLATEVSGTVNDRAREIEDGQRRNEGIDGKLKCGHARETGGNNRKAKSGILRRRTTDGIDHFRTPIRRPGRQGTNWMRMCSPRHITVKGFCRHKNRHMRISSTSPHHTRNHDS